MTGSSSTRLNPAPHRQNEAATAFFEHSSAPRINTDAVVVEALRREYPQLHLTVTPRQSCDLLSYAQAGHAAAAPIDQEKDRLIWSVYRPAARRLDGESDGLAEMVQFGKFLFEWRGKEYVLYIADGRDGSSSYPEVVNQYILSSSAEATNRLLLEAGRWSNELHEEVWVFDQGYWQKSRELYESIRSAEWENVILDEAMKKSLIRDVDSFFDGRATYQKLKVPWKRGVIYYGPPGNGKTISIKAMMHSLYKRKDPVPTLYVKTLSSFAGPEYSIRAIFAQARRYAPCYLIFEDLDSLITPYVRSYFLNEVDGLKSNDGILMVGSTNHLDQLDPGIAKRPSRFDRKYFFPDPDEKQRVAYAKFWQAKLADNQDIEFPDAICDGLAEITKGFSFAYMQEAFIAALLALAGREPGANESQSDQDHRSVMPEDRYELYGNEIAHYECEYMVRKVPGASLEDWIERVARPHQDKDTEAPLDSLSSFTCSFTPERAREMAISHMGLTCIKPYQRIEALSGYTFTKRAHVLQSRWDESVGQLRTYWDHDIVESKDMPDRVIVSAPDASRAALLLKIMEPCAKIQPCRMADRTGSAGGNLDQFPLWRELKKQVDILKEEMDRDEDTAATPTGFDKLDLLRESVEYLSM